jgi:hypothetical protein
MRFNALRYPHHESGLGSVLSTSCGGDPAVILITIGAPAVDGMQLATTGGRYECVL